MRYLAILSSASALVLAGGGGEASGAILCVSPDVASCFDTIQEAVDAAGPGDTISIRGKRNRTAYNEAVTITTENLTIQGQGASPTFRSVADTIEFGNLQPVDLADPDVVLWLDNYPDAEDFLDAVATLESFIEEETLIDRCPPVVVEVCDTTETGPKICGVDSELGVNGEGIPVFTLEASGTTFANLTIRHGEAGILLSTEVTDTTVERVCFRNNASAVVSIFLEDPDTFERIPPNNHNTTIRHSFVDGASRVEGFEILGDDAVVEDNLLLNTEGIEVEGSGYTVSFNAVAVTNDDECFDLDGPNGLVSHNIGVSCDGALALDNGLNTTVLGNLFRGVPDDDEGIEALDVPESNVDEPGNLETIIKNNIVRLISDNGVEFGASDGLFEGNLIEYAGNDSSEAGLQLRGNNNEVLYNLIRFSSQRGILIESFFDATLEQELPSSGNLIQGNLLTRNHTSGIHFPPGFDFGGGPVLQADDTTIEGNLITLNEGEGVSIPEGSDPPNEPAATNTTLTDNTFDGNRTDICNEAASTVDGGGNVFTTGGFDTDCVVEFD